MLDLTIVFFATLTNQAALGSSKVSFMNHLRGGRNLCDRRRLPICGWRALRGRGVGLQATRTPNMYTLNYVATHGDGTYDRPICRRFVFAVYMYSDRDASFVRDHPNVYKCAKAFFILIGRLFALNKSVVLMRFPIYVK